MKPVALLTTIPSDSHSWNLIYMQLVLEENGYDVLNLGTCTAFKEIEQACILHSPDVVVVSTVNGHGFLEGRELIRKIRAIPQMEEVKVYLGGKLSTDENMAYIYSLELEMAGYTKVFYEKIQTGDFLRRIRELTRINLEDVE